MGGVMGMKTKSALTGNSETGPEMSPGSPITDVEGQAIDPIWAAEFRGFFWGEGTLNVQCHRPAGRGMVNSYSTAITASIGLRSDDAPILVEFARRLGGRLRTEKYTRDPNRTITRWVCGTAADCLRIAQLLESPTGLLFNKARQLAVWRGAVEAKLRSGASAGSRYTPEDRAILLAADAELKRLRLWAG